MLEQGVQNLLGCSELVKKNLPLSGKVLALSAALADLPAQYICLSLARLHTSQGLPLNQDALNAREGGCALAIGPGCYINGDSSPGLTTVVGNKHCTASCLAACATC